MRLILAILFLSSTQFCTMLILPALPDIAAHFNLLDAAAQQVIMLYFISFGLSQLFYGPWTDTVGRRKVFITGQSLFLLGSVLCYLSYSVDMLALGRVLQGLGAGATLILSRVVLGSTMSGDKLKKALGSLAIAASFVSLLAPFIGGTITTAFDWQVTFLVFTLYVVLVSVVGFVVLPADKPAVRKLSVRSTVKDYGSLLANKQFTTAALFKWLPTVLFMCSGTYLPFALQNTFSLTAEQYGWYMMLPTCGLIVGSSLARVLQKNLSSQGIIALFWPLIVLSALIFQFYPTTLTSTLVAYSLFMIACGAYYPSCLQLVMAPFKSMAGTANALMGAIDMFLFSLIATYVNKYWVTDIPSLGSLFFWVSMLIGVNWLVMHSSEVKALGKTREVTQP